MGSSPTRPKIGFQFRIEVGAGKGQAGVERKIELTVVSFVRLENRREEGCCL